ncbi:MAG: NAD-dependent deacetylase [Blastocatellales bacterium]
MTTAVEQSLELISKAQNIVAFSGAGISTEAGIPDFRSKGGLWEDAALMELLSAAGFRRDPAGFYRASMQLMPNIHRAQPTAAHNLLALLEAEGRLKAVITQNIDGLHQAAGSQVVHEIHGSFRTGHCLGCRAGFVMKSFYEQLECGEISLPRCLKCQSPIKPDVVLFGDLLPFDVWNQSVAAIEKCDLLLVLGSSLVVYPAAELPQIALTSGARLIVVNREKTGYDDLADVVARTELGEFADKVLKKYKSKE